MRNKSVYSWLQSGKGGWKYWSIAVKRTGAILFNCYLLEWPGMRSGGYKPAVRQFPYNCSAREEALRCGCWRGLCVALSSVLLQIGICVMYRHKLRSVSMSWDLLLQRDVFLTTWWTLVFWGKSVKGNILVSHIAFLLVNNNIYWY